MADSDLARQLRAMRMRFGRVEYKSPGMSYGATPTAPEGTYTPTYVGGTTAGVTTYTFQDGAWAQFGNWVFVRGQVAWSAATGTGNARISLPFTAAAFNFTGSLYVNGVTFAAGTPQMLITGSTAYFTMGSPATNAGPTTVAVEAAGNVIWTCAYTV